jgi:DNA adenine methylase
MFSDLKRAWAVWILSAQGFSGQLSSSWGRDKKTNKVSKMLMNKRNSFSLDLAIRLQDVQLEARDALRVIKANDQEDVFYYVDPPYYNSDLGHYDGYTIEDYEMLLETLKNIKGKFLLSSYPSPILDKYQKSLNWDRQEFKKAVSVSHNGRKKIEVITSNFELKNVA